MAQTIVEKIAQAHMTEGPSRPLRAGDFCAIRPRHILTHDNTSAVISKFTSLGVDRIFDSRQPVFALDHDIQNDSPENQAKYRKIEAFAREHGIDFYPAGRGIGHQVMVEEGYVVPGSFVVASDSHSNMYGALGAIGTPVVRTDAAAVWATGEFWWQVPRTIQVILRGTMAPGVTGKDVIITLCGLYGDEVLNAVVEFSGDAIAGLTIDQRLTIANMSTEWGVLAAWFPVDHLTLCYMDRRLERASHGGVKRFTRGDLARWISRPPAPDADAPYHARLVLDLSTVSPSISGPDTVQKVSTLHDVAARRIPIQKAYLLSCVNSRSEDIEAAAKEVEGKHVAPGVDWYVAAASSEVQAKAEESGAWQTLLKAGAKPLAPGCGPCIGLGEGLLEAGETGISATNRNFKGRMGSRDAACYLGSPAVVAASAVAGFITGPDGREPAALQHWYEVLQPAGVEAEKVEIIDGFPERLEGRLVYLAADNLNTDGIYGKDYTYRELPREEMAAVVMQNYDPTFAERTRAGDIVVGGFNFGTGSSREQAVTALQAKGIALVIAASFSQTYLRNAFNNGFLCIECPDFQGWLHSRLAPAIERGEKTLIPEGTVEIDFTSGTIRWEGKEFNFPALGSVPQSLVVAGGVENVVRMKRSASIAQT
jgi:homoaconitate hydratase